MGNGVAKKVKQTQWSRLARNWEHVRAPLRPARADIGCYERLVEGLLGDLVEARRMPHVLLMGVTPEILLMKWPEDTHIVAVDKNPGMIEQVYRVAERYSPETVHARVVCANWRDLPEVLDSKKVDLVIGDGCFTQLEFEEYPVVAKAINEVLTPNGRFVHRFFLRAQEHALEDSAERVLAQLEEPFAVENFSAFKLQLLMALAGANQKVDPCNGATVAVADAYDSYEQWLSRRAWNKVAPQHFTDEELDTLSCYLGSLQRYTFPTWNDDGSEHEIPALLAPLVYLENEMYRAKGPYELSNCCITAVFRKG